MTETGHRASPAIRIVIDRVTMRGMSPRDARRLLDAVQHELTQLAPQIALAAGRQHNRQPVAPVQATPIATPRRIETAGPAIARAIVKAINP